VTIRRVAALLLVLLAATAGWRVLRPAEVLYPAEDPYPAAATPRPGVTGTTAAAPLIVQGRIRVFAAERLVRADAPVSARTTYTPRWSYRRWPQQLTGVVAIGSTVVTRWSDGKVVAIDGRTGTVAWRADGPGGGRYTGARTGAAAVWNPPGLHTAGGLVLVAAGKTLTGYDSGSGTRRWTAAIDGDCFGTAGGRVVCGTSVLDAATGAAVTGWPAAGPYTPLGCDIAASACAGVRDAAGHGWLVGDPAPRRARALDPPGTTVAAGVAIDPSGGEVVARSPLTGAETWRWSAPLGRPVIVLGGRAGQVYVLTSGRAVVALRADTGTPRLTRQLAARTQSGIEQTNWTPGLWQLTDGYLAVERLDDPDPSSVRHYFTVETVIIAAV
jgi:outer membrane protein assembly factor BamB